MLPLNGIKEQTIKEELDKFESQNLKRLIKKGIETPKPIISFEGDGLIYPNSLVVIQGQSGTNKSYFASNLASALLNPELNPKILGLEVNQKNYHNVGYLDTERSTLDQFPAAMKLLINHAGFPNQEIPENFHLGSIRNINRNKRIDEVQTFIDKYYNQFAHNVFILDVITDCVSNFNDLAETNKLLDAINNMLDKRNITFIAVIHENPINNKARGHLGTELINKATTVISLSFFNNNIISLKVIKNRLAKRQKEKLLKRVNNNPLCFLNKEELQELKLKNKILPGDLNEFLIDTLSNRELNSVNLLQLIKEEFDCSEKTARNSLKYIENEQQTLIKNGYKLTSENALHNSKDYRLEIISEDRVDFY